jgi:high-affinity nickel permease
MSPTAPLLLGMALGMRHALDADHIVAMSTIVARERSVARAARLGGAWGIGHSLSHFGVGLLVVVLRLPMSPAVGLVFERLVCSSKRSISRYGLDLGKSW